ncbi:hypothetical protein, partial [Salmonella enterica]|uniref:hypothetical protein n=1 Tax=Salmonella enterica TaxID=28901 RepID=UPI003CF6A8E7
MTFLTAVRGTGAALSSGWAGATGARGGAGGGRSAWAKPCCTGFRAARCDDWAAFLAAVWVVAWGRPAASRPA